ncbi:MAG: hypothetical protein IPL38_00625 [Rhodobacter sp.]|nr:hypothetical protein [Rhodobacter sp.]
MQQEHLAQDPELVPLDPIQPADTKPMAFCLSPEADALDFAVAALSQVLLVNPRLGAISVASDAKCRDAPLSTENTRQAGFRSIFLIRNFRH